MVTTLQSRSDSVRSWPRRTAVQLAEIPIVSYVTDKNYSTILQEMNAFESDCVPMKYKFWSFVDPIEENWDKDGIGLPVKRDPRTGEFRLVESLVQDPNDLVPLRRALGIAVAIQSQAPAGAGSQGAHSHPGDTRHQHPGSQGVYDHPGDTCRRFR